MKVLLAEGNISEDRIKDACRRILRAKIRAGRIDNPKGPAAYVGVTKNIGSKEHRQLAREAVQKSLVILKNNKILPLDTNGKVFVTGSHANNTGLQCGAWTLGRTDMSFNSTDEYIAQIKAWQKAGHKVAVVLITGRPLPITSFIKAADAFVVAWLPGSEGAGVADVLFGKVKPTGKLPHTWPKDAKQIPINKGDGKTGLYPYGYGLTY